MVANSFIYGGSTGETPQSIARKRDIARALLQGRTPSNIGEGISALGDGIVSAVMNSRANTAENKGMETASLDFAPLLSAGMGDTGPSASPAVADALSSPKSVEPITGTMENARRLDRESVPGYAGMDLKSGIRSSAEALGVDPVDLATAISYETAGTFDPGKTGPTTQWGQHRGLIQFGEPQAEKYGVDWSKPLESQLGPEGAVVKYLRDTGVKPGMGLLDVYSAINAGGVGRYGASDANNGGAPGTVKDKVERQMAGHREKAMALFSDQAAPQAGGAVDALNTMAQGGVVPGATIGDMSMVYDDQGARMAPETYSRPVPQTPYSGPGARIDTPALVYDKTGARMEPSSYAPAIAKALMSPRSASAGTVPQLPGVDPQQVNAAVQAPVEVAQSSPRRGIMDALMGGGAQPGPGSDYFPAAPNAPGQPGPSRQQIIRALTNPFASPEQKALAQDEYERLRKQNDPAYQMEMEKSRLELDALKNPKTKRNTAVVNGRIVDIDTGEVIANFPDAPKAEWEKLNDGRLFNKSTGEIKDAPAQTGKSGFRFEGTSVEAQSLNGLMDAGQLTADQAQQLGAGKTITGPNGEMIFMTPQGVFGQPANGGAPVPIGAPQGGVDIFAGQASSPAPNAAPAINPAMQSPAQPGMIPLTPPKDNEFYKTLAGEDAKSISAASETGAKARGKMVQLDRLDTLLSQSPQGMEAGVKEFLGGFGIKTDGLDKIQATKALLEQMVPNQRPPGSGTMSDADIIMFRNSLPRLMGQPEGNKLIMDTMKGITQYEMQIGDIADRVKAREITPAEGNKLMRDLVNPLDAFRKMTGGQDGKESEPAPEGIDPEDWKYMDEGQKALFR